jgi:hypothetical protein
VSKKDPRKLEKKRRKETERAKRLAKPVSLAYHGNKYKKEELIPVHLATERGIYETDVILDRTLTDRQVKAALETLIARLRSGTVPGFDPDKPLQSTEGEPTELLILNMTRNIQDLFGTALGPGRDTLIGVLRTILGSIEFWTTAVDPTSRGYLHYLQGFLAKMGVTTRKVTADELRRAGLLKSEPGALGQ